MPTHLIINIGTQNTYLAIQEGAHKPPRIITKLKTEVTVPLNLDPHATTSRTTIPSFTRYIGRKFKDPVIQNDIKTIRVSPYKIVSGANGSTTMLQLPSGFKYSPKVLFENFLSKVVKTAEKHLGYAAGNFVLTFPSKIRTTQMVETMNATKALGGTPDSLIYMINEFTAAVTAYGLVNKNGLYAVLDFGARTLDFTLFQVILKRENDSRDLDNSGGMVYSLGPKGREFKIIGKEIKADMFFGGVDFDYVVAEFLVNEFKKSEGIDLTKNALVIDSLREVAEEAKIKLSSFIDTEINVPIFTIDAAGVTKGLNVTLTRTMFEELAGHLVERVRKYYESHLKNVGVKSKNVDGVVLVGGMGNVPMMMKVVTRVFGRKPFQGVNPDEAVALGAAAAIEADTLGLHPDSQPRDMCRSQDFTIISGGPLQSFSIHVNREER